MRITSPLLPFFPLIRLVYYFCCVSFFTSSGPKSAGRHFFNQNDVSSRKPNYTSKGLVTPHLTFCDTVATPNYMLDPNRGGFHPLAGTSPLYTIASAGRPWRRKWPFICAIWRILLLSTSCHLLPRFCAKPKKVAPKRNWMRVSLSLMLIVSLTRELSDPALCKRFNERWREFQGNPLTLTVA